MASPSAMPTQEGFLTIILIAIVLNLLLAVGLLAGPWIRRRWRNADDAPDAPDAPDAQRLSDRPLLVLWGPAAAAEAGRSEERQPTCGAGAGLCRSGRRSCRWS